MRTPWAAVVVLCLLSSAAWARAGGPPGGTVTDLVADPYDGAPRWAATASGLFRFEDGRWARIPFWGTRSLTRVAEAGSAVLVAARHDGLWRSSDEGANWKKVGGLESRSGTRVRDVLSLVVDPLDPRRVLLGTAGQGPFESRDGGRSWRRLDAGLDGLPPQAFHAAALLPGDGPRPLLMGTPGAGLFAWDGRRWHARTGGLPAGLRIRAFAAAPDAPDRVAVATRGHGLWESEDGGDAWRRIRKGFFGVVDAVAVRPDGTGLAAFAGEGLVRFGPGRPVATGQWKTAGVRSLLALPDGGWLAALAHDGVWRLGPGGTPEAAIDAGLVATTVLSVSVGPDGVWCGDTNGAFFSADGGQNWKARDAGLPGAAVQALVPFQGRLYAGTRGRGVFRWDPAAGAWEDRSNGLGTANTIFSLSVDANGERLYAGTEGGVLRLGPGAGGWERVPGTLPAAGSWLVAASPGVAGRLWAAGGGALYRSDDGGATWASRGPSAAVGLVATRWDGGERLWVLEPRRLWWTDGADPDGIDLARRLGPGEQFTCLAVSADTVWLGTTAGAWRFDVWDEPVPVWRGTGVRSIAPTRDAVFLGTAGTGVVRIDG